MLDLRSEFPSAAAHLNLNSAGICPLPARARDASIEWIQAYTERGVPALVADFSGRDRMVREKLALLVEARPDEIALTHNTAEGINIIAQGYPFRPGGRILTAGKEYPANVYPWMNLASRGVALDFVDEDPDGSIPADKIIRAIGPGTAMIALSLVEWCTGWKNDLGAIAAAAHERNIPVVADGAQGIGAVRFSVLESGIDALACPAWKWLWGPLGLGFLWMKPEFMNKIQPVFVGADGVAHPEELLAYNLTPREDMRRFEYATKNYGDIITFNASLSLTLELGITTIQSRLFKLVDEYRRATQEAGAVLHGDYPPDNRSGIFSCSIPGKNLETIRRHLATDGILTSIRDGRLRISPHVYHDSSDIRRWHDGLTRAMAKTE